MWQREIRDADAFGRGVSGVVGAGCEAGLVSFHCGLGELGVFESWVSMRAWRTRKRFEEDMVLVNSNE